MGKPGNKNQSAISNIFKRVPNYNYEKEGSEAIVPGIGGMGEESSENVYMSDVEKSPLQQTGGEPVEEVEEKPKRPIPQWRQEHNEKFQAKKDAIAAEKARLLRITRARREKTYGKDQSSYGA
tara:strand:+ start:894 stop:1262 length:369 start_codon:yes stop_codon:yes gene_type:complete